MSEHEPSWQKWLHQFAALHWYEATITFLFTFVAKTSELLLTAGIVVSTANFLTDGQVLHQHQTLSLAWSWAQAIAIDGSLGVVCMNTVQAWREREYGKAACFLLLTLLLATVAGLITHFDALAHAAGLPVMDKSVSGIIPLWVMTALRALAVIGFLLASRLKQIPLTTERSCQSVLSMPSASAPSPSGPMPTESAAPRSTLDAQALATALLEAMQQAGIPSPVRITEEQPASVEQREPASQGTAVRRRAYHISDERQGDG